jgi:hypothetical protein
MPRALLLFREKRCLQRRRLKARQKAMPNSIAYKAKAQANSIEAINTYLNYISKEAA